MGKITNYDEDPVFELTDVLSEYEGQYETSPGGVCLNSIRTASWMGATCAFVSSIGEDRLGETMRQYMAGIQQVFEEIPGMQTGAVLVLLKGEEHSHIGY